MKRGNRDYGFGEETNQPSSSCSRSSTMSSALPISWRPKLKGVNIVGSESKPAKEKQRGKGHNVSASSSLDCARGERGGFYGDNDDGLSRLTARTECVVVRSELYESNARRIMKMDLTDEFRQIINDANKKRREFIRDTEIFPGIKTGERENGAVIMTPRIGIQEDKKPERSDQRVREKGFLTSNSKVKDKEVRATKSVERTTSNTKGRNIGSARACLRKHKCVSSINIGGHNPEELELNTLSRETYMQSPEKLIHQWQKLKEMKIKEVKSKAEQQRKSMDISRELSGIRTKQDHKVRVVSPRASTKVEKCRIKALEDLKKAKLQTKAREQRAVKGGTAIESFAVVKCSSDPQKDFRDSMIEMILENRINRPKELEELLVCYLMLNSDEYHDMIITVFRQAWVDLKQYSFES